MRRFRFKKIDAFTGAKSPGNPAGCVYLDHAGDISAAEMQEIARQLKGFVSEVAYVSPEGDGFFLRYYSSEREVDFCGHATIAVMNDLLHGDGPAAGRGGIMIRVGSSRLAVLNDGGDSVFIASPEPKFLPLQAHIDEVLRPLFIPGMALDDRFGISLVNSGLNSLLVPMRQVSALTDVTPDIEGLTDLCVKYDIDIVVLFTNDRILPGSSYRTRVFAPRFGYLEDPATGSGNAALGNWLLHEGHWDGSPLVIEQGTSYRDPNIVRLKTQTSDGGKTVLFGGGATVRIDGWYQLY